MIDEDGLEAALGAAKNAKKAMVLTVIAVMVAIVVLALDHGIKNNIIREAKKAQAIFDQITEAADGASQAGGTGTDPGNSLNGGSDLVHDAPAGEVLAEAQNGAVSPPAERKTRPARRPAGNG